MLGNVRQPHIEPRVKAEKNATKYEESFWGPSNVSRIQSRKGGPIHAVSPSAMHVDTF